MNSDKAAVQPVPWDPHQRPVELIDRIGDDCFHLENIRWGYAESLKLEDWVGRFSDGVIDTRRVEDVYVTIVPFPPEWISGHSFIVFVLPRDAEMTNREGDHDRAVCLSIEARTHIGEGFNAFAGLKKTYRIQYSLSGWRDEVQHTCRWQGKKIIRYRLKLDAAQRRRLLIRALEEACIDRSEEYYNTTHNSCFSNLVRLINEVLPPDDRLPEYIIPNKIHNFGAANPVTGDLFLYRHNLAAASGHILTQPDQQLWPRNQAHQSWVGQVVEWATETLPMRPVFWLAGAWAMARVARRPALSWPVAAWGAYIADHIHDLLLVRSHTAYEPSEPYLYEGRDLERAIAPAGRNCQGTAP